MLTTIRVGIIHAYPSAYILDSLARLNAKVVLFCPQISNFTHPNLEACIECPLDDWDILDKQITTYHATKHLDALLPIYEGAVEITAIIAKKIGVFGCNVLCAQSSRNKFLAWQKWHTNNLPTPKTIAISSSVNSLELVKQEIGFPAVLKLADSMNSQGVILVKNDDEFTSALNELNSLINRPTNFNLEVDRNRNAYARSAIKIIAQEFCEGAEVSVDILCNNGDYQVVGLFEKTLSKGPYFAETMSIHPTSLGTERDKEMGDLAIKALQALNFKSGVAHIEIRDAKNGPKLLEAGLRPGGAYTVMAIEHLYNINLYVMLLKIHLGLPLDEIKPSPSAMLYGGIVYQQSGVLKTIQGTEVFNNLHGLLDVKILNNPGDIVIAMPNSAQPHFCYYLLTAETSDKALEIDNHIKNSIQLEILEAANG